MKRGRPTPRTEKDAATRASRADAGRALRRRIPRSSHAAWRAPADRGDPIARVLLETKSLIPELVPIRFARMATSPFAFFRGSAGLMARDLARTPTTDVRVQLCGDAHLANFGVFATPERDLVFDVNDFDETLPGSWEWDLKRLAVSLVLAGPLIRARPRESREVALRAARTYRKLIGELARGRYLDIYYFHLDRESIRAIAERGGRRQMRRELKRGAAAGTLGTAPRFLRKRGGVFRIQDQPPLIMHPRSSIAAGEADAFLENYLQSLSDDRRALVERYHVADVARKVVGVGSVGTDCQLLLLMADSDVEEPLFLQLKQALPSALEPFAGASLYSNPAERVVAGQRLIQESSDVFLGWSSLGGRHYYVRQFRDQKFTPDPARLTLKMLRGHGELCASALARAHARTGYAPIISGYLGRGEVFDEAIADFAMAYSHQVHDDHQEFLRAVRRGRIPVSPEN